MDGSIIGLIIIVPLGIALGIWMGNACDRKFAPTPVQAACAKRCEPNRGIIRKNACYCGTEWKEAPYGK